MVPLLTTLILAASWPHASLVHGGQAPGTSSYGGPSGAGAPGLGPPPSLGRPFENETAMTMDEMITGTYGNIDLAANAILGDNSNILAELDMYLTKEQFLSLYEPPKPSEMKKMGMYPEPFTGIPDSDSSINFLPGSPPGSSLASPPAPPHAPDDLGYHHEHRYGIRSKRKAAHDPRLRWTGKKVPYLFANGHFDEKEEYMIHRSMTEWERYTCVRFHPATGLDQNILRFQNGVGCNSQLGMVGSGTQVLNLQSPGCRYKGLYLHEIGHALGLVHEHQLPDRDNYIDILYHNVSPHMRIWFNKYTNREVNQMGVPYELSSVMHYGITAFSYNGKAQTIRAKDQSKEDTIGKVYLKELGYTDVAIVNKMYECAAHCPDQHKCGKDGYLDQNCHCICRDGSSDCDRTKTSISGCVNTYDSWSCFIWANQGECDRNDHWMGLNCAKACGKCGQGEKRKLNSVTWTWQWLPLFANMFPPEWMNIAPCSDSFPMDKCQIWKHRGDCITNKSWMKNNCAFTCKLCNEGINRPEESCANKHDEAAKCDAWALDGECVVNQKWMYDNCKKSCKMCGDDEKKNKTGSGVEDDKISCEDTHHLCEHWQKGGECINNPNWMNNNCRKSCQKCEDSTCKNLYDDTQCDIWEQKQECIKNTKWMRRHCAKSCGQGLCHGGTNTDTEIDDRTTRRKYFTDRPIIKTTKKVSSGNCANRHNSDIECDVWARYDHCSINPNWMRANCRKACDLCDDPIVDRTTRPTTSTRDNTRGRDEEGDGNGINPTCRDEVQHCAAWAKDGYCERNAQYNLKYCKKSCNNCNGCKDQEFLCDIWAKGGQCENNPGFMLRRCQKSCKACIL